MGSLEESGSRLEWAALSCKVTGPGLTLNQEPHKDDLAGKRVNCLKPTSLAPNLPFPPPLDHLNQRLRSGCFKPSTHGPCVLSLFVMIMGTIITP